jgi:ppGpp synthetase/RelA/SpoT-type nucleotidyltranferase
MKFMPYPPRPIYTKSQINRAGQVLVTEQPSSPEYQKALEIVNAWRASHAYPISTFKSTLRKKVSAYKNPIVAQRLKRLPTIIDKLNRYPAMQLSRMQDIGGIRGIVNTVAQVRNLQQYYSDETILTHTLVRQDDYISNPKDDGYRGIHLVYKYNNTLARNIEAKQYKGLLLELQLRTKLQHTWSTAVETMGTFRGEALKSRQGDKSWLKFFALTSSAFAHVESTSLVPGYESLSAAETYKEVIRMEKKLNVLEHIKGLSVAANAIHTRGISGYYHLIVLKSEEKSVTIQSFKQDDLLSASNAYAAVEAQALKGARLEPVLVSVGRLKSLKLAYPNYFLDVRDFIEKVEAIVVGAGK